MPEEDTLGISAGTHNWRTACGRVRPIAVSSCRSAPGLGSAARQVETISDGPGDRSPTVAATVVKQKDDGVGEGEM